MKYPQISALVPKSEHFDESAVTGEGVWLSTAHIDAIENHFATQATGMENLTQSLDAANNSITEFNSTIEGLNADAAKNKEAMAELNNQVTSLQEENKNLGGQSSGTGTTLEVKEDEKVEEKKNTKTTLNSVDHPLNQFAARRVAAKSKK